MEMASSTDAEKTKAFYDAERRHNRGAWLISFGIGGGFAAAGYLLLSVSVGFWASIAGGIGFLVFVTVLLRVCIYAERYNPR